MALNLSEYQSWSVLDFTGKYSKVNLSEIQVNMKLLPEEQLPGVYFTACKAGFSAKKNPE
jgi:hypothetical protein